MFIFIKMKVKERIEEHIANMVTQQLHVRKSEIEAEVLAKVDLARRNMEEEVKLEIDTMRRLREEEERRQMEEMESAMREKVGIIFNLNPAIAQWFGSDRNTM